MKKHIQKIITIGPSTRSEKALQNMLARGVDFVRVNMSHSSINDLKQTIALSKKVGIPFIIDTEGSQIRTGRLKEKNLEFFKGDIVRVYAKPVVGDRQAINLTPDFIVGKLTKGDLLYCDFDSLVMCVSDSSTYEKEGYITARVVSGGLLGNNKGVYIDTSSGASIDMPALTEKDYQSIAIGLEENIGHIAASFMRSGEAVRHVREATKGKMKIISKIECIDGLKNLDDIIDKSDALLIDRGDLSKEIFLTRIPFTQKIIVHRARCKGKHAYVATNFLESMIHNRKPTRAEIHDIESSITDGAAGLTLAAETAIGEYPMKCINVMNDVIEHVTSAIDVDTYADKEEKLVQYLEEQNYLLDFKNHSPLIYPHGGKLVNRYNPSAIRDIDIDSLPRISLDERNEMDAEQIALGVYSPLEGFMRKAELQNVLDSMRLPSGVLWPLPIVLDISKADADMFAENSDVLLCDQSNEPLAVLHLKEKYAFDKKEYAQKLYGTLDEKHPGVRMAINMGDVFLGGPVTLLRRRQSDMREFELTPSQTRRLFENSNWSKIVGFHTRNVIHRGHEYIQMKALEETNADGLFIHPVVGKKKPGDYYPRYIVDAYRIMLDKFYPPDKAYLGTFSSWSRYAGPKEALFTALCRQNYGCSHFIIGRDHTGVGNFYSPTASIDIFNNFPELAIKSVSIDDVISEKLNIHRHKDGICPDPTDLHISGTQARRMFERREAPPEWFMRPEISQIILDALANGEEVFVPEDIT